MDGFAIEFGGSLCRGVMVREPVAHGPAPSEPVAHGLAHWRELLEEWILIQERDCRIVLNDAIYWNTEQSNVGALASAAWRAGWVALQEFVEGNEQEASGGRFDLYLQSCHWEDWVEAKMVYVQAGTQARLNRLQQTLTLACQEVCAYSIDEVDLNPRTQRIGVVFAIPSLPVGDQQGLAVAFAPIIDFIEQANDLDAVAWCFPPLQNLQPLIWQNRCYPGVFLLARLCTCSAAGQ